MRCRKEPDAVNSETFQRTAQWFQALAGDCDETVLESDLERLVARILDQFGVLEIAVWEQLNLSRFFHPQALGAGIRAPAIQILCP